MISSVRARVTFVATAAVAVVLAVASFGILKLVEDDLLETAERAVVAELELQATEVGFETAFERSFELDDDDDDLTLGTFTETAEGVLVGDLFEDGVPVLEIVLDVNQGDLIGVYDPLTSEPVSDPELLELVEDLTFETLILDSGDSEDREVFVGATARDEVDDSLEAVRGALLLMVPTLVLTLGALIWLLVGRALKPVAAMTDQVADISTRSLDKRVPVPTGNDEIANLASVMNDMLGRLEQGDTRQRQFAADASHELRSPLSTVRIAGEMLEQPVSETRRSELAEAIVAESDRMDVLIGDLLELSRIDEADGATSFALVNIATVISEACADRSRVTCDINNEVSIRGDQRQLVRAVSNLADNAERHAGQHIRVTLDERDGLATLFVEDDGPGVAEDQRDIIFERFARSDQARDRASGGTGLGLALVRAIAQRHGGDVSVDQSPDLGGARFVLTLGHAL